MTSLKTLENLKTLVADALVSWKKWLIIVVLLGVSVAVGLKVYSRYKLELAHQQEVLASGFKAQAEAALAEADKHKKIAEDLTIKLNKATEKATKLQAQIDKITTLPSPTAVPPTTKDTLADLKKMGLELVIKPSMTVAPSVAGITAQDANKAWFWGQEALRVPGLELKLEKTTELVGVLNKNIGVANSVIEARTKEADAALKAADRGQKQADALDSALTDTKKAMAVDKKKLILYPLAAFGLGYLARR